MYLYERNENKGDKVDVYSFIPDEGRLAFYRRRIINSSDIDKMFCCLEIDNSTILRRFVDDDELDVRFLERKDENDIVSLIHDRPTEYDQLKLLDNYINGKYSDISPTITFIPEDSFDCFIKAYLSPWPLEYKIISKDNKDYYCLDNIIRLPIELCRLQLLLNGKFDVIDTKLKEHADGKQDKLTLKLKELLEQKRNYEAKEIMDAYLKSGKSYEELMTFLQV